MSEKRNNHLIECYNHAENRRNLEIDRIWETAKFFTTIFSAIVAITTFLNTQSNLATAKPMLLTLPAMLLVLNLIALLNLRREYTRFLEAVVWLKKIEKVLGLHEEIDEKRRFFKNEKYVLPDRFVERGPEFPSSEDYIRDRLSLRKCHDTIYFYFSCLFLIYIFISFVLMVALIIL